MANPEITDLMTKLAGADAAPRPADPGVEGGPGTVGASVNPTKGDPLVPVPMDPETLKKFWLEIEKAEARRAAREASWDILLDEYMPVVNKSGVPETVKVQAHFRNTHTKLGSLFYRSPDLILTPDDPGPGNNQMPDPRSVMPQFMGQQFPPLKQSDIISIKQAVLKKTLGRDGIKANRLMDELLFDVLQYSGIGVCKIGYRCVMKNVPRMGPDPKAAMMPGSVLGLASSAPQVPQVGPDGQPLMDKVPIFEDWYARRISPKKYLCDSTLKSTRVDEDANWVGMDFFLLPVDASKMFNIPLEQLPGGDEDDRVHKWDADASTQGKKLLHCYELWVKSSVYVPDQQPHPQALHQLILIKGLKERVAVWRPSPDQEFDKEGRLTPDSLIGFPIKVLTIRDLADSCFPPADAAFTNSDIKQLSTWRRQSIKIRDASISKYLYEASAFGEDELEQLKNGDVGDYIAVEEGRLKDGPDKVLAPTSKVTSSADDQRGFMGIKQDMNETLGIGANQAGTETDTVRTATEADKVASAVQARNDKELGRVVDFYLDVARGIDQLLMRYMTQNQYVEIGGDDAARVMAVWNGKLIKGKFLYDIAPDSQLRPDNARDFARMSQYYNLTAKDPFSNRMYVLKRMARMMSLDPSKATMPPPPPPQPQPDMPKITLSLTAMDLGNPVVMEILQKAGVVGVQMMPPLPGQPPHGGPAPRGEVISEHMQSNSGGRENAPGAANFRKEQAR